MTIGRDGWQAALRLPVLITIPIVDLLTNVVLGIAVVFLNFALEQIAVGVDQREVIVGEFSPLLF